MGLSDIGPKPSSGDSRLGEKLYDAGCASVMARTHQVASAHAWPIIPSLSNDQAFWKIMYEGRHVMPSLQGALTDQQMAAVRAWLLTLR